MAVPFKTAAALVLVVCYVTSEVTAQLSESQKQEILDLHNVYRSLVSPTASNMQMMVWNDELAQVAQTFAEGCVFQHNSQRTEQSTFDSVGENIAWSSATTDYSDLVELWHEEVDDYNYDANSCSSVCGHYTQIVWANSRDLGCGGTVCQGSIYLVCNYGPAGNFNQQRPYLSGAPCTQCDSQLSSCSNNLCSEEGEGIDDEGPVIDGEVPVIDGENEVDGEATSENIPFTTTTVATLSIGQSILMALGAIFRC